MTSIHELPAIDELRKRHKFDSHRLRRMRVAFYRKQLPAEAALAKVPPPAREALAAEIEFHTLRLESRHDSQLDGASKLVFRTASGMLIESVVLRMASGRTALCLSTQVGCAANCDFCATGKMGIARNLSRDEILDQVVQANQVLRAESRRVRNVVFMGMGEPLHNEQQLFAALDVLCSRAAFDFDPRRLLVSTVGIPPAMLRLTHAYPQVRLALSLHSARQDVRARIMPIAEKYDLTTLRAALVEVCEIQSRAAATRETAGHNAPRVMIEYLMLAGVNDAAADAEALIEYLRGLSVHINLIPFNPIADAPHLAGSDPSRRAEFSAALKRAGYPVTTRYSLGADIAAACGQLVRQENRARAMLSL